MKKTVLASAGAVALLLSSAALARVDVGIGVNLGVPPVVVAPPVYYPPAPVYVAPPAPVYYPPPPVYVAPRVVYPYPYYGGYGGYYGPGWHHGYYRRGWHGHHH